MTENYVNFIFENSCPKAISVDEVIAETNHDDLLQNVKLCIKSGIWHKFKHCEEMSSYSKLSNELTVLENGCILRGHSYTVEVKGPGC